MTLPASSLRFRYAPAVLQVNRPACFFQGPGTPNDGRKAHIPKTASPQGEEELAPKVVERRGYLPIPWCDTRAGVWVPGDASVEPIRATVARAIRGRESLSVIVFRDTATSSPSQRSARSVKDTAAGEE